LKEEMRLILHQERQRDGLTIGQVRVKITRPRSDTITNTAAAAAAAVAADNMSSSRVNQSTSLT
jgi:hypothetical protein